MTWTAIVAGVVIFWVVRGLMRGTNADTAPSPLEPLTPQQQEWRAELRELSTKPKA